MTTSTRPAPRPNRWTLRDRPAGHAASRGRRACRGALGGRRAAHQVSDPTGRRPCGGSGRRRRRPSADEGHTGIRGRDRNRRRCRGDGRAAGRRTGAGEALRDHGVPARVTFVPEGEAGATHATTRRCRGVGHCRWMSGWMRRGCTSPSRQARWRPTRPCSSTSARRPHCAVSRAVRRDWRSGRMSRRTRSRSAG